MRILNQISTASELKNFAENFPVAQMYSNVLRFAFPKFVC